MNLVLIGIVCTVIGFSLTLLMLCSYPTRRNRYLLVLGVIAIFGGISILLFGVGWQGLGIFFGALSGIIALFVISYSSAGLIDILMAPRRRRISSQ